MAESAPDRSEGLPLRRLKPRERLVLAAVIKHATYTKAAVETRLHYKTVAEIMRRPNVQRAYQAACDDVMREATQRLRNMADGALTALEDLLTDEDAPVRLAAVRAVMDYLVRIGERTDVLTRLAALEAVKDISPGAKALPGKEQP